MKRLSFFLLPAIVFLASCTKDSSPLLLEKPPGCDSVSFSYRENIEPIILSNCVYCHYSGSGNYDYSSYAIVADRVRSGRFEERLLLPPNNPLHMPQEAILSECDLFVLRSWIHQGFKNN